MSDDVYRKHYGRGEDNSQCGSTILLAEGFDRLKAGKELSLFLASSLTMVQDTLPTVIDWSLRNSESKYNLLPLNVCVMDFSTA